MPRPPQKGFLKDVHVSAGVTTALPDRTKELQESILI